MPSREERLEYERILSAQARADIDLLASRLVSPETIAAIDIGIEERLRAERLDDLAEILCDVMARQSVLKFWSYLHDDMRDIWRAVAQAAINYCGKE